jgi:predicted transcriptional regulator
MYVDNMKTITVNVSEPVYREFQEYAREHDRTASELIREALANYREDRMRPRQTLRGLRPLSLGKVLRPLKTTDDLMEEMNHA